MARKTKEKELEELRKKLADDISWRNEWSFCKKWKQYDDYYRNTFKGQGIVPVNLYFPYLRGTIPQIYFRNPSVSIGGNQPTTGIKARVLEFLTRILINQLGIKAEMKQTGQDTWMHGLGCLATGYDSEFGIAGLITQEGGDEYAGGMARETTRIEYNTGVIPGLPWSLRLHPLDVTFAWGTVSAKDIRRYTIRKLRLIDDIREDPKYDNAARKKVEPGKIRPMYDLEGSEEAVNLAEDWAYVYETHDLHDGKVYVTVDGVDAFLKNEEDELCKTLGGPSVTPVVWNPAGNSIWGIPDAEILENAQKEINDANTQLTKERRADLVRVLVEKGVLSPTEAAKFTSEEIWAVIETEDSVDGVKILGKTNRTGALLELEAIKAQAQQAIGLPRTRMGEYTPASKRTTGTEIEAVEYGGDIRADDKRDALADALVDCVQKWHRLIFRFWQKPRIIYAPGIAPQFSWIVFRGTDLKASYNYRIQPEELRPVTQESRREEAALLGPKLIEATQAVPGLDARAILRQVIGRFQDWDVNSILPPVPGEPMGQGLVGRLLPDGTIQPLKGMMPDGTQTLQGAAAAGQ